MARAPRKGKVETESSLLTALKFIRQAQQEIGVTYQTHCRFTAIGEASFVVAFNGVLGAGHPVEENFAICPHTYRLIDALTRARGAMSLTALDSKELIVKAGNYRAAVSCAGDGDLTYTWPDPPAWPLTDAFREAAALAGTFNAEGASTVMGAAVVTRDGSVIGTDGRIVIEAWHGQPTPPGLVIPMAFVKALVGVKKAITNFGFSAESFTVYFDDKSWLKTQLYRESYPDVDRILVHTQNAKFAPIDKGIAEAIEMVKSFSETGRVWIGEGRVRSHESPDVGAVYTTESAAFDVSFNCKHLLPFIVDIDWLNNPNMVAFRGEQDGIKLRGIFSKYA